MTPSTVRKEVIAVAPPPVTPQLRTLVGAGVVGDADPDGTVADREPPGCIAGLDRFDDRVGGRVDPRHRPAALVGDPDRARADGDAPGPLSHRDDV